MHRDWLTKVQCMLQLISSNSHCEFGVNAVLCWFYTLDWVWSLKLKKLQNFSFKKLRGSATACKFTFLQVCDWYIWGWWWQCVQIRLQMLPFYMFKQVKCLQCKLLLPSISGERFVVQSSWTLIVTNAPSLYWPATLLSVPCPSLLSTSISSNQVISCRRWSLTY
jgi:hypothetical protein